MKDYSYTESPLDMISKKREELSSAYLEILCSKKKSHRENIYWLPIWIAEYDKSIEKLKREKYESN